MKRAAVQEKHNYAFEADAVRRRTVSCCVRAPHGSTRRWASGEHMGRNILIIFVSVIWFLSGCATKYQREGWGGGFTETQLGENIFQVSFRGNGYTRADRAADFALLRSAEVATSNGFRYFIVVDSEKGSTFSTYTAPTQSYTTANASVYGNTAYGSAITTTTGGETYLITKPSATNTIVCFKEKPDVSGLVFDAEFITKSLKDKYGIKN